MTSAVRACAFVCVGLAWAAVASAQDARPVHPANSETVSYAALDKLPDWRGLWFPAIGKVGGTTAIDTGTPLTEGTANDGPGFVGTWYDEIVPESGRLFLGFNDQEHAFGDNTGAFTVVITLSC